jgi:hypothetical protein
VVSGATSRQAPCDELSRVLFLQLSVVGSTMGTRDELNRLARFGVAAGVRPVITRRSLLIRPSTGSGRWPTVISSEKWYLASHIDGDVAA